ncbi:MAG: hypothetical protein D6816_02410 [Bacteroidetes bacterium]|nr:MAG: hypothetical protein D6816_02410 [Bacteroidota bacterium]
MSKQDFATSFPLYIVPNRVTDPSNKLAFGTVSLIRLNGEYSFSFNFDSDISKLSYKQAYEELSQHDIEIATLSVDQSDAYFKAYFDFIEENFEYEDGQLVTEDEEVIDTFYAIGAGFSELVNVISDIICEHYKIADQQKREWMNFSVAHFTTAMMHPPKRLSKEVDTSISLDELLVKKLKELHPTIDSLMQSANEAESIDDLDGFWYNVVALCKAALISGMCSLSGEDKHHLFNKKVADIRISEYPLCADDENLTPLGTVQFVSLEEFADSFNVNFSLDKDLVKGYLEID